MTTVRFAHSMYLGIGAGRRRRGARSVGLGLGLVVVLTVSLGRAQVGDDADALSRPDSGSASTAVEGEVEADAAFFHGALATAPDAAAFTIVGVDVVGKLRPLPQLALVLAWGAVGVGRASSAAEEGGASLLPTNPYLGASYVGRRNDGWSGTAGGGVAFPVLRANGSDAIGNTGLLGAVWMGAGVSAYRCLPETLTVRVHGDVAYRHETIGLVIDGALELAAAAPVGGRANGSWLSSVRIRTGYEHDSGFQVLIGVVGALLAIPPRTDADTIVALEPTVGYRSDSGFVASRLTVILTDFLGPSFTEGSIWAIHLSGGLTFD